MQSYEDFTKEELVQKLHSLDRLNKELLLTFQKTERLEFAWTGNLGQWFWDFTTNEVTFNPLKAEAIGYIEEDLPEKVPFQFFTDKLHPDDKDEVMQRMKDHLAGKIPVWEVKYRIQAKDGSWKVYQDRGKVTKRDEEGAPLFLKGIVFDITEEELGKEQLKSTNDHLSIRLKKDGLTSLYTRSAIAVKLGTLTSQSKEQQTPLSIIFLKIDHFNKYEEDFGIVLTEEIVKTTSLVIQSAIQDNYVAGRYRESVFLILLKATQKEQAAALAETIRKAVFETLFDAPRHVSVSAGVSSYEVEETISELVQRTAKKLLAADRNGGNQVIT